MQESVAVAVTPAGGTLGCVTAGYVVCISILKVGYNRTKKTDVDLGSGDGGHLRIHLDPQLPLSRYWQICRRGLRRLLLGDRSHLQYDLECL